LNSQWNGLLESHLDSVVMHDLMAFLQRRRRAGAVVYPPSDDIYAAFSCTPFEQVRAVILGQDPYHGAGQAHGLSFSVRSGIRMPPSLRNIYREISQDVGCAIPTDGCLQHWVRQGVFLLNAVLTVEEGKPGAHKARGWEHFTDVVIDLLNRRRHGLVFFLWGNAAQKKGRLIDRERHLVLEAAHPSPLSAYRGFFGCRHFSQCNQYLTDHGQLPITWSPR